MSGWRSLARTVDRRRLLGALLAVIAGAMVLILTRPAPSVPVVVAERTVPAGAALGELQLGTVRLPDSTGLLGPSDLETKADWTLTTPIAAGEPIPASLAEPPGTAAPPDVLALVLEDGEAALGDLVPGDAVDIYVTRPTPEGALTEQVATSVRIVATDTDRDGLGSSDRIGLLLAVDDPLATLLVAAHRAGDLDLVRVGR